MKELLRKINLKEYDKNYYKFNVPYLFFLYFN